MGLSALLTFTSALKLLGDLLRDIAEIEGKEGKRLDEILKEVLTPSKMVELSSRLTPETYAAFVSSLFRLSTLNWADLTALPSDEKKKVAEQLKEIAETIERAVREFEGRGGG